VIPKLNYENDAIIEKKDNKNFPKHNKAERLNLSLESSSWDFYSCPEDSMAVIP
jgi:hypothetical protein